uniref:Peptidase A2 domain-containing protein n=1 Tax=Lotharella globosa TaxID=91324 RepID=A0A7S3YT33_9EUKA
MVYDCKVLKGKFLSTLTNHPVSSSTFEPLASLPFGRPLPDRSLPKDIYSMPPQKSPSLPSFAEWHQGKMHSAHTQFIKSKNKGLFEHELGAFVPGYMTRGGTVFVPTRINERASVEWMLLDTGTSEVIIDTSHVKRLGLQTHKTTLTFNNDNVTSVQESTVESMHVGPLLMKNISALVAPLTSPVLSEGRYKTGILGYPFFQATIVELLLPSRPGLQPLVRLIPAGGKLPPPWNGQDVTWVRVDTWDKLAHVPAEIGGEKERHFVLDTGGGFHLMSDGPKVADLGLWDTQTYGQPSCECKLMEAGGSTSLFTVFKSQKNITVSGHTCTDVRLHVLRTSS